MGSCNYEKFINKKVLIGSPICQNNEILNEFLQSLKELNKKDLYISYCFVDDNKDEKSKVLLKKFKEETERVNILDVELEKKIEENYICDSYTHRWSNNLVEKVATFKNKIIKYFLEEEYDYLFFIDSDIVLHPLSLKSLLSSDKDIVSNIFWTRWSPEGDKLPQVWLKDSYTLYNAKMNVEITMEEIISQTNEFLNMLRKPGVYKVGGLGACTLIKRAPLAKGVNFNEIYNISFWGEDRAFCIRAVCYGFDLYVDTHYPAYHIYRKEDLKGITKFKTDGKEVKK